MLIRFLQVLVSLQSLEKFILLIVSQSSHCFYEGDLFAMFLAHALEFLLSPPNHFYAQYSSYLKDRDV